MNGSLSNSTNRSPLWETGFSTAGTVNTRRGRRVGGVRWWWWWRVWGGVGVVWVWVVWVGGWVGGEGCVGGGGGGGGGGALCCSHPPHASQPSPRALFSRSLLMHMCPCCRAHVPLHSHPGLVPLVDDAGLGDLRGSVGWSCAGIDGRASLPAQGLEAPVLGRAGLPTERNSRKAGVATDTDLQGRALHQLHLFLSSAETSFLQHCPNRPAHERSPSLMPQCASQTAAPSPSVAATSCWWC